MINGINIYIRISKKHFPLKINSNATVELIVFAASIAGVKVELIDFYSENFKIRVLADKIFNIKKFQLNLCSASSFILKSIKKRGKYFIGEFGIER